MAGLKESRTISRQLSTAQAAVIPVGFAAALVATTRLLPQVGAHAAITASFYGAAGVLGLGALMFFVAATRSGRDLSWEVMIKTPHWLQMMAQGSLMVYWGAFLPAVYGNMQLIVGQLLFAYGFDALLQFIRGNRYKLGFGPFPILFSINFFLWFRPEYYYWQFVVIALGFAAKAFIHWERDGRTRHIFNPSSFPLSVFSLVLILTGTTGATFGQEIAQSLFNPPHIYLAVFLVTLPAQILFGVATMTIAAVTTAFAFSAGFYALTGAYFFRDAYIPIAVFLGMHLLFTDPATSPRTEQGRVIFGVLYASFTIALAGILEFAGAPTFYDKLLPIPILNLMVRRIDAVAVTGVFRYLEPARLLGLLGVAPARLATAGLWALMFVGLGTSGGVGDSHPGQYLPFWQEACAEGNNRACEYVADVETVYCERGSSWACNELGVTLSSLGGDPTIVRAAFEQACAMDFGPGCENSLRLTTRQTEFVHANPPDNELPIVIRGSKGPVTETDIGVLYSLACERGWTAHCTGPMASM